MKLKDIFRLKKKKPKKSPKRKAVKKAVPKRSSPKKSPKKKAVKRSYKKTAAKKKAAPKKFKPTKPVEINRNECPECGSANVVISEMTGNTICQDCGAIFAGLSPEMERHIKEARKQG